MLEVLVGVFGFCGLAIWVALFRAVRRQPPPPLFAKLVLFVLGGLMLAISGYLLF